MERDKFDNKTVSFEEHIKFEHSMWHYLYFLVLVRVKDPTEYTGPESYVAQMIAVSTPTEHAEDTPKVLAPQRLLEHLIEIIIISELNFKGVHSNLKVYT